MKTKKGIHRLMSLLILRLMTSAMRASRVALELLGNLKNRFKIVEERTLPLFDLVATIGIVGLAGSVEPEATVYITNQATSQQVTIPAGSDGAFSTEIAGADSDVLTLVVRDAADNTSDPVTLEPPLPLLEMTLGVMVINMRYLLIGASLRPLFAGRPLWQKALGMHLVADENWAVTMAAHRQGRASSDFLFGGGCCLLLAWCLGTMTGHQLGAFIRHPEVFALDFAFIAVFTALTTGMWRGKTDVAPWVAAALIAVAAEALLPGKWYIVAGGLGGALVPALQCFIGNRDSIPSVKEEEPHVNE